MIEDGEGWPGRVMEYPGDTLTLHVAKPNRSVNTYLGT
jgi:hypothetical protein